MDRLILLIIMLALSSDCHLSYLPVADPLHPVSGHRMSSKKARLWRLQWLFDEEGRLAGPGFIIQASQGLSAEQRYPSSCHLVFGGGRTPSQGEGDQSPNPQPQDINHAHF